MQSENKRRGHIVEYVNENGLSKTVIKFKSPDALEGAVRNMLDFAGFEDCSFYIHQHVNRSKYRTAPHRQNYNVNNIFKYGFDYHSYNNIGQTLCRMGMRDLYVGDNWTKSKEINKQRDQLRQSGTLLDVLTFDAMNYDYEGMLSDENCVTILALPKYIDIGNNKKAPFGFDYRDNVGCYDEGARVPYCEMKEDCFLRDIMEEKYADRTKLFINSFCKQVSEELGVSEEVISKMPLSDLFKLDKNDFFKTDRYISGDIVDKAFDQSYLKDGQVYFEKSFKANFQKDMNYLFKQTIFPNWNQSFRQVIEQYTNSCIQHQQNSDDIDHRFVLGNIAFGSEKYGFEPIIEINNNFFKCMDKESLDDFMDTLKIGAIKFGEIDTEKNSQEEINKKIKNKTDKSFESKEGVFRKGSAAADWDFD